jgi:hypothetical protein
MFLNERLQHRKKREWGDKVKLLFGDMRYIEVPEKVDILISELLGSFGDNELSPECLDGANRFLKRSSYRSLAHKESAESACHNYSGCHIDTIIIHSPFGPFVVLETI